MALSIPHYVIKKGRCHGARHGITEEQKQYHTAFNAWKSFRKRVDSKEEHYVGIRDRFLRDQVYRWHSKIHTEEFKKYQGQWYLTLNKSDKKRSNATSIIFSSSLTQKPSPSWIRWGNCGTDISTAMQEMALFLKRYLVGHVQKAGGAHDKNFKRMKWLRIFFVTVSFAYSWWRSTVSSVKPT